MTAEPTAAPRPPEVEGNDQTWTDEQTVAAFASDLGWKPGEWPQAVTLVDRTPIDCYRYPMAFHHALYDADGDATAMVYETERTGAGWRNTLITLTVFND